MRPDFFTIRAVTAITVLYWSGHRFESSALHQKMYSNLEEAYPDFYRVSFRDFNMLDAKEHKTVEVYFAKEAMESFYPNIQKKVIDLLENNERKHNG